ncbi:MAG: hypothetical protein AMXMBFR64_13960 [Myxococcales bacterium]
MTQAEALALSLVVEVPVVLAVARRACSAVRLALIAVAATLVTHPFAWLANGWIPLPFAPRAALIEASVVVAEAVIYGRLVPLGAPRAALASVMANAASFAVGLVLVRL